MDAIDIEARDAAELDRFRADLDTPQEDPQSPFQWVTALLGVILGVLLVGLCGTIARMFGWEVPGPAQILLFMLGLLTPLAFIVWRRLLAPWLARRGRETHARFAVRFDSAVLAISLGAKKTVCDLADIERFESKRTKIVIVRRNGTESVLPLAMPTAEQNEALAERLGDALLEARTAGGYRGARIGDTEEAEEAEEDDLRRGKA